mmetsp:Transcript_24865/g.62544  ORF Transcript_24865/g.62544 Transcript_24865/m.62544 type:complete len:236 (-) Transcript_24865:1043-1750(-)
MEIVRFTAARHSATSASARGKNSALSFKSFPIEVRSKSLLLIGICCSSGIESLVSPPATMVLTLFSCAASILSNSRTLMKAFRNSCRFGLFSPISFCAMARGLGIAFRGLSGSVPLLSVRSRLIRLSSDTPIVSVGALSLSLLPLLLFLATEECTEMLLSCDSCLDWMIPGPLTCLDEEWPFPVVPLFVLSIGDIGLIGGGGTFLPPNGEVPGPVGPDIVPRGDGDAVEVERIAE